MLIYIIVATFFYFGFFISDNYQNAYYKASIIMLFFFTAFRDISLGGTDAISYQNFFYYRVPMLSDLYGYKSDYEFGYTFLNSIIKTIINDYRYYQIIYTFLSITLLCILINKLNFKKQERNLFIFVYFCYRYMWNSFVLLRQNIPTLIIWIILLTFLNKPFKYYFNSIISVFFHKSSIVNLFIYPLLKRMKKVSRNKLLLITAIISIVFLIFTKNIFNSLTGFLVQISGPKYAKYIIEEEIMQGHNTLNYLMKWFFVLLFYFNFRKIDNSNKQNLLNISFIALMLSSIDTAIVNRMVEYYMIAIYAIITVSHRAFERKSKILYMLSVYVLFITILIRFLYSFNGGTLMNYSTFLLK